MIPFNCTWSFQVTYDGLTIIRFILFMIIYSSLFCVQIRFLCTVAHWLIFRVIFSLKENDIKEFYI